MSEGKYVFLALCAASMVGAAAGTLFLLNQTPTKPNSEATPKFTQPIQTILPDGSPLMCYPRAKGVPVCVPVGAGVDDE